MKYFLFLPLFILVSCVPTKKVVETTSGNINTSAPYVWFDKSFPKSLGISEDFTAAEVTNITSMSAAWSSAVENKKTFFDHGATRVDEISNSTSNLDGHLDGTMAIYRTTRWPFSLPGSALAVTQIFGRRFNTGSSDEYVNIEHADIMVNFDFYQFDTDNSGHGYDLRTVILHEMGHFLGLQHKSTSSDRNDSVMYPSINSSEAKRAPTTVDSIDIAAKYGITIGGSITTKSSMAAMSSSATSNQKTPTPGEAGDRIKILIELHADGECVHKIDGDISGRHQVRLN